MNICCRMQSCPCWLRLRKSFISLSSMSESMASDDLNLALSPSNKYPTLTLKYPAIWFKISYFGIDPFFYAVTFDELRCRTLVTNWVGFVLFCLHNAFNWSKNINIVLLICAKSMKFWKTELQYTYTQATGQKKPYDNCITKGCVSK